MKTSATLLIISLFFASQNLKANPISGGEITYTHLTGMPNLYRVTLSLYANDTVTSMNTSQTIYFLSSCQTIDSADALLVSSNSLSPTSCINSSSPGFNSYTKYIYQIDIQISLSCHDWDFYWEDCCRNQSISNLQNPGAQGMILSARLNNNFGANSSPVFLDETIRQFLLNAQVNTALTQRMIEPDGDSLFGYFTTPKKGPFPGTDLLWESGFSAIDPVSKILDPSGGSNHFVLSNQEVDAVRFQVDEYRFDTSITAWVYIGSICREVLIEVDTNSSQTAQTFQMLDSLGGHKIIADCGVQEIRVYSSNPVFCSSIKPDGSDFRIHSSTGLIIPIVSAEGDCNAAGLTNSILLKIHQGISQNDSLFILSQIGGDGNTLINQCGFALPIRDSLNFVVRNCSKIGLEEISRSVGIFPNPFEEKVEIKFEEEANRELFIYDGNGVLLQKWETKTPETQLDLTLLARGLYILEIKEGENNEYHRILKD